MAELTFFVEPMTGGLVTVRDAGQLQRGQLTDSRNMVLRPGTRSLHRAAGRAVFGVVSADTVSANGIRDVKFDNGDIYLVASQKNTRLVYAKLSADTGTFSALATVSAQSLEAAHYRNRFYLLNGATQNATATAVNSNVVMYLSATAADTPPSTRQHGMVPVADMATTATSATAFSQTVTGYYEYWTTEVAKLQQDGAEFSMESTFVGQPVTVFVSSTGMAPVIQRPTIANPAVATHWNVYRSTKKDAAADKRFPTGFLVATLGITATASVTDTSAVLSASAAPSNANGALGDGATVWLDMGVGASAAFADGGAVATMQSTGLLNIKQQGFYGFNLGGFSGSVKGIEVFLEMGVNTGTSQVSVSLCRKRQTNGGIVPPNLPPFLQNLLGKWSNASKSPLVATKSVTVNTTLTSTYTLGSSTDRWFASDNPFPLADTDFTATDFMVLISFNDTTTTTLSVDRIVVTVYYGSTIDSVVPFPTVVYTFGDISAQVGKNGPPSTADTGEVFEDALVLNDITNPSTIRYSYPGDPEAFPATYYLDFETRENDRVRAIKLVNDRLVVLLDSSSWRVNYLPSERDASFDRGKAISPISRSYGCLNAMCACHLTLGTNEGTELLAFVSYKGIHTTNGYDLQTRTGQLDWRAIQSTTSTSTPIALINDPEREELLFYFRNDALGSETYQCLHLSYSLENIDEEGNFKASGPVHMRNHSGGNFASLESAWPVQRASGQTSIYLGYGGPDTTAGAGKVYVETGTTLPSLDSTGHIGTRRFGPGGRVYAESVPQEWRLDKMYTYMPSYTAPVTAAFSFVNSKTNASAEATVAAKSYTLAGEVMHRQPLGVGLEGARVSATITATDLAISHMVFEGTELGLEDSGK